MPSGWCWLEAWGFPSFSRTPGSVAAAAPGKNGSGEQFGVPGHIHSSGRLSWGHMGTRIARNGLCTSQFTLLHRVPNRATCHVSPWETSIPRGSMWLARYHFHVYVKQHWLQINSLLACIRVLSLNNCAQCENCQWRQGNLRMKISALWSRIFTATSSASWWFSQVAQPGQITTWANTSQNAFSRCWGRQRKDQDCLTEHRLLAAYSKLHQGVQSWSCTTLRRGAPMAETRICPWWWR